MTSRALTDGELAILRSIQEHYGPQNRVEDLMFSDSDEAVSWVRDVQGAIGLVANLTVLADLRRDGSIASERDLLVDWLGLPADVIDRGTH